VGNRAAPSAHGRRDCRASRKYFTFSRLERGWSSWKMHQLFTRRVLFFRGRRSKVRNVNGREDRSLESKDESELPRRFHVRAHPSAVQNPDVNAKNRGNAKEKFEQSQHGGHSGVPERIEDASPQPAQAALQIIEAGRSDGSTKGLRSTPRSFPPNKEALTHPRGWRAVAAPASGP